MHRRRDANEKSIVNVLKAFGCSHVWRIESMDSAGAPDLLVIYKGKIFAMEVKTDGGRLTKEQVMNTDIPIVRNETEALRAIGINA